MRAHPLLSPTLAAAALLLSGCDGSQSGTETAPSAADSPAGADAAGTSGTDSQGADAPDSRTPGPGQEAPAVDASGMVDPADYQPDGGLPDSYYFMTADGAFACTLGPTYAGCDSAALPDSVGESTDAYGNTGKANAVAMDFGQKAKFQLTTNPVYTFAGPQPDMAGGRVLPAGATLAAGGASCTATEEMGVECTQGDHGFAVSSQQATVR